MARLMKLPLWLAALLGLVMTQAALAQEQERKPNSLLLIAKPSLVDPNFQRTVVLVTQADDASTVGVILNRPTTLQLRRMLSREYPAENYRGAVYEGGPVMPHVLVALFRAESTPKGHAFPVLKGIYLTLHPENIEKLIADPKAGYRLYAGFSGWAPRQLQREFTRDDWYVQPADEAIVFRERMEGLWDELVEKAQRRGPRTRGLETRPGEIDPMARLGDALQ
jgi:putative transcriptional regulator